MQKNTGFLFKNLILIGHRKNYVVPFHPGVNIIYGDADTGKSSILRLIYYCLGGKKIEIDHEIASSVKHVILETEINSVSYCISRDLFDTARMVEVFNCSFEDIADNFPVKYAPNLSGSEKSQSISEFLLEALDFPAVKLKQAPSKEDSALARLSFLDLFKYCYMDQDDVGSKALLNAGHFSVEVKNKEVFKYIFNVLDDQITEVAAEISLKAKERNELQERLKVIEQFLIDTEFEALVEIEAEIESLSSKQEILTESLEAINLDITSSSQFYAEFKNSLNLIYSEISTKELSKARAQDNLDRFGRLKNDYISDIEKLKAIEAANDSISAPSEKFISCPLCESNVLTEKILDSFAISEEDKVRHEVFSLNRRVRDLNELLEDNRKTIERIEGDLKSLYNERDTASRFVDEETQKSISPYLSQRDAVIIERAAINERKEKVRHELKVRNLQSNLAEKVVRLSSSIELLHAKQLALQENAPSMQSVFTALDGELYLYLRTINIKNCTGISIDRKSYLPKVRDKEYRSINSGGLRTITSIGYLAILQSLNAKWEINLPNVMLIDTVGKYLGKTKPQYQADTVKGDDEAEGISDPQKYKKIYDYLIALSEKFEEKGRICQFILVDNDVPPEIAKQYQGFVVAHYSSDGKDGAQIGLIDDWDTHGQTSR